MIQLRVKGGIPQIRRMETWQQVQILQGIKERSSGLL